MGALDTLESKIEKAAKKKIEEAPDKAKEKVQDKVQENVVGWLCTKAFKSEENQNRCKALNRLSDIASDGKTALGSCTVAAGAGAAEVGTDGAATPVAGPVGYAAGASCLYNSAKVADSSQAMVRQMVTGKETKTLEEEGKDIAGTWIKKKLKDEIERQIHEAETADLRHFQELNPGATAQDYNQMQDLQDQMDDGTAFQ